MVEHWITDPAARVRFPPKSWELFQPNLLCFVLCYDFHVVRHQRKGSSVQMVLNIFRLLVKSNRLCRYSDNKLGFQSLDRQLCKPFYSRAKCFKMKEAIPNVDNCFLSTLTLPSVNHYSFTFVVTTSVY